jgi:hypothetical protein
MIKTIISIVAKNPPSIAIAMAGVLALMGQVDTAVIFLAVGTLLQVLWLLKSQRG